MTTRTPRIRRPLIRGFARPAGFLVALAVFLLLPNTAVSCSLPDGRGTIESSLTGTEMITGSRPSLAADGELTGFLEFTKNSAMATSLDQARADRPIRLVTAAVVVLLLLGIAVQLIRPRLLRAAASVDVAAGAGVLVVVVERLASARWEPILREAGLTARFLPENEGRDAVAAALDTRHPGLGFWLVLTTLAVIVIANAALLVSGFRRSRPTGARQLGPH
ncbi:hypothetical protein L6E12_09435 [Actinokineospora sp. PR83]|uniref:hypothetical protein n=1 Tax=Actinokineospora sp. PR83 TaxID=2884908 RepID=UPI001F1ADDC2|nr:hypothetical protein [Actinokineospora sp. PR83]MCG8916011.1 hypothetical protein [Actinokineospora sp. PR83]